MSDVTEGLTAEAARDKSFGKPPWGKRGYDEKSVDDFLQLVARRLEGRGQLSAEDVRNIRFPTPRIFKRGYHKDEVDEFLARAEAAIAALHRDRPES